MRELLSTFIDSAVGPGRRGLRRRDALGARLEALQEHMQSWAAEARARGVRSSVEAMRAALDQALVVLGELPANDEPLLAFAGRVLNDPRALDPSTRLSTLVLSAVAVHQGLPRPGRAASRRELWRSVGVTDDALSSMVRVAGFATVGHTRSDRLSRIGFEG
ncbi:TIGR02679 domain-containing protein [Cellulomonas sp. P22]|uniref:TIGR02679 domain-containing protein n=1 Tax=Cellulomonas sp. P22 TaxID=3373189 RepID=UPI0037BEDEA6